MSKRGRKPIEVTKQKYADEYWKKNQSKLEQIFPYGKQQYDSIVRNVIDQSKFKSKTKAKAAFDDMVYDRTHTIEQIELRKARQEADNNPFNDMRKLNGKFSDYQTVQAIKILEKDENDRHYQESVIGYWEIKNSDYILAQVEGIVDDNTPYNYYTYIRRDDLGL